jgi:hypothetical protein
LAESERTNGGNCGSKYSTLNVAHTELCITSY